MKTKHLTYQEAELGYNVAVFEKDRDLPGTPLGSYKHEDAIEPFGPIGFPPLRSHVLKLLREAHTDNQNININTVAIKPGYEVALGTDLYEEPVPAQDYVATEGNGLPMGVSADNAPDPMTGVAKTQEQLDEDANLNTADKGGENGGVVQETNDANVSGQGTNEGLGSEIQEKSLNQAQQTEPQAVTDTPVAPSKAATSVKLDKESYTLKVGESVDLKVSAKPKGSTTKFNFESADQSIVTVDADGKLTGVAPGTTQVGLQGDSADVSATAEVTVQE
jgi:hypothetical protein